MKHDQFTRVITILTPRGHEPPDTQVAELLSTQLNVRDAAGYEHAVHASASYRDATPEEASRFWRQRCEALQGDLDSITNPKPPGDDRVDALPYTLIDNSRPLVEFPSRRQETRNLHRAVAHAVAEHRGEAAERVHIITVGYTDTGLGTLPSIKFESDLMDPANFGRYRLVRED